MGIITYHISSHHHRSDSSSEESDGGNAGKGEDGSPTAPVASPLHSPLPEGEQEGEGEKSDSPMANGKEGNTVEGIFGDAADVSSS